MGAVRDYLDEDVAYFVGLLVGRGQHLKNPRPLDCRH
jgi:hypothetical protein